MDFDNNVNTGQYGYEYGMKLGSNTGLTQFGLYSMPNWVEPPTIPENKPSYFTSGTYIGQVNGVYTNLGISDRGYPNYVIELAIPKSMVGNPDAQIGNFHLSEYCGNDHIPAPEFPFILLPVAVISAVALIGYHISKRAS
jgi:hypothetical protein